MQGNIKDGRRDTITSTFVLCLVGAIVWKSQSAREAFNIDNYGNMFNWKHIERAVGKEMVGLSIDSDVRC